MFSWAVIALVPAVLASLTTNLSEMGIRLGIDFRATTFTTPTGTPTVEAIVESADYLRVELFAANLLMNGGLCLLKDRVLGSRVRLMVRMSANVEELDSHFTICVYDYK